MLQNGGAYGGSDIKESICNAGELGSVPGLGRSPGEGHGNQLQYSCLENPMDRGAWRATVHRVAKSWTRMKRLSTQAPGTAMSSVMKADLLISNRQGIQG